MAIQVEDPRQPEPDSRVEPPLSSEQRGVDFGAWVARLQRWNLVVGCWLKSAQAALAGVTVAGVLLEWVVVSRWLRPFSISGHSSLPGPNIDMLQWFLGDGPEVINDFIGLLVITFVPYLVALVLAGRLEGRAPVLVAFGVSLVLGGTMLAVFPAGAVDIVHNILDGRLMWIYHLNPMVLPPSAISADPLFPALHYWHNTVSPYGPLWFLLTGPAVFLAGDGLIANIVAFKVLPFAFEIVSLACIAGIAQRMNRRRVAAALICFGWNPMVLWEIAGNGHNDSVLIAFVLLAVLLLFTRHWPAAFPALICSVLVKYVSLILLPLFVVWLLRRHGRAAAVPMAMGLLASAVLAVIIVTPFWTGGRTFAQVRQQRSGVIFSPASAISMNWGEDTANSPEFRPIKNKLTAAFIVLYGLVLLRMKRSRQALVKASVEVMFLFLVLMAWWFWPWYAMWGLGLAALLAGSVHARLFVMFSATAMLLYVASAWRLALFNYTNTYPMALGTALFVFAPPVLYAVMNVRAGDDQEAHAT